MIIYELSTYPFIKFAINSYKTNKEYFMALLLLEHGITNYGLLEEHINSGTLEFQDPYFKSMMQMAYANLARYNHKKITAPVFVFDTYTNSGLDSNILDKTDLNTSCEVLPFTSPLTLSESLAYRLKDINIHQAKEMLSCYGSERKNALEMCVYSFGHYKSYIVANLINFYDKQIVRTANATENYTSFEGSLFTKDFDQKREIV